MIRASVKALNPYTPGEQPKIPNLIKLNTNENAYPPSPKIKEVLSGLDVSKIRLYPDPECVRIRQILAEMNGCDIANIFVANGSDEVLQLATEAWIENDGSLGYFVPSYSLYPVLADIRDVKGVGYSLPNSTEELKAVASSMKNFFPDLFFFANPNAPTSTMFSRTDMKVFCEQYSGIVLIDEAYVDFADDNCLSLALSMPNVVICRTMSKSWSLAGIRLGYLIGSKELVGSLYKIKDSYNVNALTQMVAIAALSDPQWAADNRKRIINTRTWLIKELSLLGWDVADSATNFVWAKPAPGATAVEIKDKLRKHNIIVRYFPEETTKEHIRITVGTDEEIAALLKVLKS